MSEQEHVRRLMSMPPDHRELHMKSEAERLRTYGSTLWPIRDIMSPEKLASAGFYYTGVGDTVQCAFCGGVLEGWGSRGYAMDEHKKNFGHCRLVMGLDCGNITVGQPQPSAANIVGQGQVLGADHFSVHATSSVAMSTMVGGVPEVSETGEPPPGIPVSGPKHPQYAEEACRLLTYDSWSFTSVQSPKSLAKAGFFYTGSGDQVKCFYCDGNLHYWTVNHNPWEEHARRFPKCCYLRTGSVAEAKNKYAAAPGSNCHSQDQQRVDKLLTGSSPQTASLLPFVRNPAVQQAQSFGYSDELIRNALDRYFPNYISGSFPKCAELMQAIFEAESGDEPSAKSTRATATVEASCVNSSPGRHDDEAMSTRSGQRAGRPLQATRSTDGYNSHSSEVDRETVVQDVGSADGMVCPLPLLGERTQWQRQQSLVMGDARGSTRTAFDRISTGSPVIAGEQRIASMTQNRHSFLDSGTALAGRPVAECLRYPMEVVDGEELLGLPVEVEDGLALAIQVTQ